MVSWIKKLPLTQDWLQRSLLPALLAALHLSLMLGPAAVEVRALILLHLGLLLIWQPLGHPHKPITPATFLAIVITAAVFLIWMNWWLLVFWLTGLAALMGGKVYAMRARRARLLHLLALVYLLMALLLWSVPQALPGTLMPDAVVHLVHLLLPCLLILMLFVPPERLREADSVVLDFFYSLTLFLLMLVLVLGTLAMKAYAGSGYFQALMQTILFLALGLVILGWLWNPRAGFEGLGVLFSRSLLSLSLPFEEWSRNLARLAEQPSTPLEFLQAACAEITHLPYVNGGVWRVALGQGEFGAKGRYQAEFNHRGLTLLVYTRAQLRPALHLHVKLLVDLLGEFYVAKLREQALQQNAYVQAVHETGARLTHDVKNLLQSLKTLCTLAQSADANSVEFNALIRRQLPQISQRLELTLDKLRAPNAEQSGVTISARAWWSTLQQRHSGDPTGETAWGHFRTAGKFRLVK